MSDQTEDALPPGWGDPDGEPQEPLGNQPVEPMPAEETAVPEPVAPVPPPAGAPPAGQPIGLQAIREALGAAASASGRLSELPPTPRAPEPAPGGRNPERAGGGHGAGGRGHGGPGGHAGAPHEPREPAQNYTAEYYDGLSELNVVPEIDYAVTGGEIIRTIGDDVSHTVDITGFPSSLRDDLSRLAEELNRAAENFEITFQPDTCRASTEGSDIRLPTESVIKSKYASLASFLGKKRKDKQVTAPITQDEIDRALKSRNRLYGESVEAHIKHKYKSEIENEEQLEKMREYTELLDVLNARSGFTYMPQGDSLIPHIDGDRGVKGVSISTVAQGPTRQLLLDHLTNEVLPSVRATFLPGPKPQLIIESPRGETGGLRYEIDEQKYPMLFLALRREPGKTPPPLTSGVDAGARASRNTIIAEQLNRVVQQEVVAFQARQATETAGRAPEMAVLPAPNINYRVDANGLHRTEGGAPTVVTTEIPALAKTNAQRMGELNTELANMRRDLRLLAEGGNLQIRVGGDVKATLPVNQRYLELENRRRAGQNLSPEEDVLLDTLQMEHLASIRRILDEQAQLILHQFDARATKPEQQAVQAATHVETIPGQINAQLRERIHASTNDYRLLERTGDSFLARSVRGFFEGYRRHGKLTAGISLAVLGVSVGLTAGAALFPATFAAAAAAVPAIEGFRRFFSGPLTFLSLFDLLQRNAEKKQRSEKGFLRIMNGAEVNALSEPQLFHHMAAIEADRAIKGVNLERWLDETRYTPDPRNAYDGQLRSTYLEMQNRLVGLMKTNYEQIELSITSREDWNDAKKIQEKAHALRKSVNELRAKVDKEKGEKAFRQVGGVVVRFLAAAAGGWFVGSGKFGEAITSTLGHAKEGLNSLAKFFGYNELFPNPSGVKAPSAPGAKGVGGVSAPDQAVTGTGSVDQVPGDTDIGPERALAEGSASGEAGKGIVPPHGAETVGQTFLDQHSALKDYGFFAVGEHGIAMRLDGSHVLDQLLRHAIGDARGITGTIHGIQAAQIENMVANMREVLLTHQPMGGMRPEDVNKFMHLGNNLLTITDTEAFTKYVNGSALAHSIAHVAPDSGAAHAALETSKGVWETISGSKPDFSDIIHSSSNTPAQAARVAAAVTESVNGITPEQAKAAEGLRDRLAEFLANTHEAIQGDQTVPPADAPVTTAQGSAPVDTSATRYLADLGMSAEKISGNMDSVVATLSRAWGNGDHAGVQKWFVDLLATYKIDYPDLSERDIDRLFAPNNKLNFGSNIEKLLNDVVQPSGKPIDLYFDGQHHSLTHKPDGTKL